MEEYLRHRRRWLLPGLGSLVLILVLAGCGVSAAAQEEETTQEEETDASGETTLTVFAASSLQNAFGDIGAMFKEQNPDVQVNLITAGSPALLTQMQQGAPADVFAPANEPIMESAEQEGLVEEPTVFANDLLAVVVPAGNPAGIGELGDLANPGVRYVASQDGVPITDYTEEVLGKAEAEYGEGFEQSVLDNVASTEINAQTATLKPAKGEAYAVILYSTEARSPQVEGKVEVVEIPEDLNATVTYPIAALSEAQSPGLAQQWVDLVLGEEGQAVLEGYGFAPAA